ncbi:GNAT family N-acetyltransferase [Metabacillus sp. JX24]|uniref:GNAT family N-acetyltransferase n=1 Tax=Metabacillus sp. JX24 TaxID=3240759 RepID=UPI00350EDDC2
MIVRRMNRLQKKQITPLLEESKSEGFRLVERLVHDFQTGKNKFSLPGEALFGVFHHDTLIAVGGLNRDPYDQDKRTCRIRRFYVGKEYRRKGAGTLLLKTLLREAAPNFSAAVLRTDTKEAARFYERAGFSKIQSDHATHGLTLGGGELHDHKR